MIIGFLSNKLTLRGTEVAIYDYANYNELILGNRSIIVTRDYNLISNQFDVDKKAYDKFTSRFCVEYYDDGKVIESIENIIDKHKITHLFIEKAGGWDGIIAKNCKTLIHSVFDSTCPHGTVYTVLGQTINNIFGTSYPVMPYMVDLPYTNENLRSELGLPDDAIVFGRYGGKESFDIEYVHRAIKEILNDRQDIYFIFMNTNSFYAHPRIKYLEGTSDMIYKRKFINTCDALIHARSRGETFGLTCAEFAICKKPVITCKSCKEQEHLIILRDKAVLYDNKEEVYNIFMNFERGKYDMENNGYMFYNPLNVIQILEKIFLKI